MATPYPPRRCPSCGTDNLPLAPACVRCDTALGPTRAAPVIDGPAPSPVGLAVVVGALIVALAGLGAIVLRPDFLGSGAGPSAAPTLLAANAPPPTRPPGTAGGAGTEPTPEEAPTDQASAEPAPNETVGPQPTLPSTATPAPRPGPGTVRLPDVTAEVPGATRIRRYAISGDAPIELARSMSRRGDDHCGTHAIACVRIGLRIADVTPSLAVDGSCTIASVRLRTSYVVWLPRWTRPARADRELVAWWREVLDHIAWHEGRHIAIHKGRVPDLRERLVGAECDRASAIARRWHRRLQRAQDAFDLADSTWTYPRYDGP